MHEGCDTLGAVIHRRPSVFVALAASTATLTLGAAGCGDDAPASDARRFCSEAAAQRDMIVAPPLGTEQELTATLDFYRLMGQLAPVAIAEEWNDLVATLETASTVVPGDAESEQRAAIAAYATERSASEVATWLQRNCGVEIPITTIAPQGNVPARTTTVAPPPEASGTAAPPG